ncbi:MAG: hypothetical protein KF752_05025 [Pirellulaceae bacterium]|nr:hypothetical protein [Pirellulaceae bacterium]
MIRLSFRLCLRLAGCLALYLQAAMPVRAIDITFTIDNPQNNPSYDPDGSKLASIAQAAATMWMSLRPGNETYHWNIHWEDFDGPALAVANNFDGSIKFRINAQWFIDPTPLVNEEFGPFQTSYVDSLDFADKNQWFAGTNPPNELEYGYTATASSDSATNRSDLLTVMLHEMGHLSGIGFNSLVPDVPIPDPWIGMRSGVKVRRENEGHIMPEESLMYTTLTSGTRILPSALDVLVNAHEKGAASVHLDRVDFSRNALAPSDNNWSTPFNWIGGQTPDLTQHVRIGFGNEVVAALPANAKSLDLSGAAQLTVFGDLNVVSDALVDGESEIIVKPQSSTNIGGILALDTVGSKVTLDGGHLVTQMLIADPGVALQGHGKLSIQKELDNNGRISAKGGTLVVDSNASTKMNLSGSNNFGSIEALSGDLVFAAGDFEKFVGKMRVAEGRSINFKEDIGNLYLDKGSKTYFEAGAQNTESAVLMSTHPANALIMRGNTEVDSDVYAIIDFHNIVVAEGDFAIKSGGTIDFRGASDWALSHSYSSAGTLVYNAPVAINANVGMTFGRIDLDGKDDNNKLTIGGHKTWTLTTSFINDDNRFRGDLQIGHNAELNMTINSPIWPQWGSAGQIDMYDQSRIKGSLLRNEGLIDVKKGTASIHSDFVFGQGSTLNLDGGPGSFVTMNMLGQQLTYEGGSVTTSTALTQETLFQTYGKSHVTGNTTITTGYFNWDASTITDSSTRVDPQTTLTIRAGRIGLPDQLGVPTVEGFGDTIDLNSGHLDVLIGADNQSGLDLPSYWSITEKGRLNLNWVHHTRPSVQGSRLVNHGTISGHGAFINLLENHGQLVVGHDDNTGTMDLSGEFFQYETGNLILQLGGLMPGTQHDQLRSQNYVHLDGQLLVSLLGDYLPQTGDMFRLIDATNNGKVLGQFHHLSLPELEGYWDLIYGDSYVDLRYSMVPEPSSMFLLYLALAIINILHRPMARPTTAQLHY